VPISFKWIEKNKFFSGVELQSKRDEAENRTILGRNDLLPSNNNNLHTHTLHPTAAAVTKFVVFVGVSCAEFSSLTKEEVDVTRTTKTHAHTLNTLGMAGPLELVILFSTRGTIINSKFLFN
jgi:hypothetical protein